MPAKNDISLPPGSKIREITTDTVYDIIILGAGPAGLTAAVYAMRKGLDTAMLTDNIGGQMVETAGIENYMGYRHIDGTELVDKFFDQIMQFPIGFKQGVKINGMAKEGALISIRCDDSNVYGAKSVIVATGKSPRRLNVPGEREFTGRGVAYCAICDAPLYKGLVTAVIGGGNSAVESAIDLCKIAKRVHVIQLLGELTADEILVEKLNKYDNIEIHFNSGLEEISGDTLVKGIRVKDNSSGETFSLDVDGVFIAVGLIPNTGYLDGFLGLNDFNEIIIDRNCKTDLKGVFAAGDVTNVTVKQIIVAAGEGAKAALAAHQYLLEEYTD